MEYRLLIDMEVIETLQTLSATVRQKLLKHFRRIQDYPSAHSDYRENDSTGRTLEVSVIERFAVFYWEDFADRHVKIMSLKPADRT